MNPACPIMAHEINADRSLQCTMHADELEWTASPSATVSRKRLALQGPLEAGRVTSIVEYSKNSSFHEHGHPDGEEILVLEGAWQGMSAIQF
jgi:quercetin dioxygenase-like cupin family protein